jgi:hypothetical protein
LPQRHSNSQKETIFPQIAVIGEKRREKTIAGAFIIIQEKN